MVKNYITIILLLLVTTGLLAQDWERNDLTIYETFDEFEEVLHRDNDTTYLINFWATWCGPCVKELPHIEEMNDHYKNEKYQTVLVSLDFPKQIDSKLIPFLNKHNISSEVIVLLDGKSNNWIDRVDDRWSGAIPITIIYNKEKRLFLEKQFHSEKELVELIDSFINN